MASAITAVGTYITVASLGLSYYLEGVPGPGFASFWVGLFLIVCGVIVFGGLLIDRNSGGPGLPFIEGREGLGRVLRVTAGSVAMVLITGYFGMLIGLALFMAFMLRYEAKASWRSAIRWGIGVPLAFYLVFARLLEVRFPVGLLFEKLGL